MKLLDEKFETDQKNVESVSRLQPNKRPFYSCLSSSHETDFTGQTSQLVLQVVLPCPVIMASMVVYFCKAVCLLYVD